MKKKKKDKVLHIRIESDMHNKLISECKKENIDISKYIRKLILKTEIKTDPDVRLELNNLRREVNRIGVNINQIAKNTNAGIYSYLDREILISQQKLLLDRFETLKKEIETL